MFRATCCISLTNDSASSFTYWIKTGAEVRHALDHAAWELHSEEQISFAPSRSLLLEQ